MRDFADQFLVGPSSTITTQQALAWFQANYPKTKPGTIKAHLTRMSTNDRNRVHFHGKPGADDLFFRLDTHRFRRYVPGQDPEPIWGSDAATPPAFMEETLDSDERDIDSEAHEFAYERDLREFLAKNLSVIEPGLRLYEEDGMNGVEFPADGRRIDILALDAKQALVVIELKVSRAYDRVIGQMLYYKNWVQENLADPGQSVRGMIIGRTISNELRVATTSLPDIELFEYALSFRLSKVDRAQPVASL